MCTCQQFLSLLTRCKGGGDLVVEDRGGGDGGAAEGAVGSESVLERGDLREAVPGLLSPLHHWSGPPGEAGAGTKGTMCCSSRSTIRISGAVLLPAGAEV